MKLKFLLVIFALVFLFPTNLTAQTEETNPLAKSEAFVALLASYSNTKKENSKTLLENVEYSNVTNFSIKAAGGYFIKEYFALGLGAEYSSQKEDSENVNTFGPNSLIDKTLRRYTFSPFIRNYFPIGSQNRFFIFTQTGLEIGWGNGEEVNTTGDNAITSDIEEINYGLAFTPGVTFIVERGFAFEVNVGVLGLKHSKETITPSDDEETVITKTNFNFDINLLSLNLGISYYF